MKSKTRMIDVITSLGEGSARRASGKSNSESLLNQVGFLPDFSFVLLALVQT